MKREVTDEGVIADLDDDNALARLNDWKEARDLGSLTAVALDASVNHGSRWFAARYLGDFDDALAIETLAKLLANDDMRLRQQAARSLGEIGEPARTAVPALVHALFDGEGPVRLSAARALGAVGDTSAIPHLVKAAETTPWDTLHSWVTASLLQLGAPEAAAHLVRRLDSEKTWQRRWAARGLADLGATDALTPLRRARTRDPLHRRTYTRAIRAIERRFGA